MQGGVEPGIGGVTVTLYDGSGGFLDDTVTDADGFYLFDELPAGSYVVEFDLPDLPDVVDEAWTIRDHGDDAADSDAGPDGRTVQIDLALGEVDLTWDAGIVASGVLGSTPISSAGDGTLPFTGDEASQSALLALGVLASGAILVVGHSGPEGLTGRRYPRVGWAHQALTRYRSRR